MIAKPLRMIESMERRKQVDERRGTQVANQIGRTWAEMCSVAVAFTRESIAGVCLAVLLAVVSAESVQGAEAPVTIDAAASCATAECHSAMTTSRHIHAPVAKGQCDACHEPTESGKHSFKSIEDVPGQCNSCHDKVTTGANIHAPAADDCLNCHDPHTSKVASMLKSDTEKDLCFACHDESILDNEYQHGPAAAGACSICHDPHSSTEDKLLKAKGKDLCGMCHMQMVEEMAASKYIHGPVQEDCSLCHDPHSGPNPGMLQGKKGRFCTSCHAEIGEASENSKVNHAPVASEDGCLSCHVGHASNTAALLKRPQTELCLGCHDGSLKGENEDMQDMKTLFVTNPQKHGPIREGGCTGCHQPHGSKTFRLLTKEYPAKFYSPFDPENYDLCFTCHEKTLVTERYTKTLTGFRDGDVNMHFLHVNKETRGRTCRACHEVHASSQPVHMRESVPYGSWSMPINYKKTATGGSCLPGCHKELNYDRDKTVQQ